MFSHSFGQSPCRVFNVPCSTRARSTGRYEETSLKRWTISGLVFSTVHTCATGRVLPMFLVKCCDMLVTLVVVEPVNSNRSKIWEDYLELKSSTRPNQLDNFGSGNGNIVNARLVIQLQEVRTNKGKFRTLNCFKMKMLVMRKILDVTWAIKNNRKHIAVSKSGTLFSWRSRHRQ